MAIAVTCQSCGVGLRFKSEHEGKTAACRNCFAPLLVAGEPVPDHDVFVSYSTKDKNVADAICAALERKRIRCWIAPRDVVAGKSWAGAITDAIDDARLMVLLYSGSSNTSPQVLREVDRAVARGMTIVPFRIENAEMTSEMKYYIAASHWLDAIDGPMESHVATLVGAVRTLLTSKVPPSPRTVAPQNILARRSPRLSVAALMVSMLVVGVLTAFAVYDRIRTTSTPAEPIATMAPATAPETVAMPVPQLSGVSRLATAGTPVAAYRPPGTQSAPPGSTSSADPEKDAGIRQLQNLLLTANWWYVDGLNRSGGPIRFYPNNKFSDRWHWNYWVVGPRLMHVQYKDANYDPAKAVVFRFNEDLSVATATFGDDKIHHVRLTRN